MKIKSSEITPKSTYLNRRDFIKTGVLLGGAGLAAACGAAPEATAEASIATGSSEKGYTGPAADDLGDALTSKESVTNFNNYYEFSTDKEKVAELAKDYVASPWEVSVEGHVNNPKVYGLEDLLSKFTQQERIYRLRCVEGWSMVIPWTGFLLKELLEEVEPTSNAKFVRFETIHDTENMPGLSSRWYQWPYVEGLRLDEAMNDLTLMATGLYGESLPAQNGAPLRLLVPWKYGFKSIKTIVKIELVDYIPQSLWMAAAPQEYGFYANVNPEVNHPRWSQGSERRIGELGRRETLMFNGYAEQVAHLYDGMDLRANY